MDGALELAGDPLLGGDAGLLLAAGLPEPQAPRRRPRNPRRPHPTPATATATTTAGRPQLVATRGLHSGGGGGGFAAAGAAHAALPVFSSSGAAAAAVDAPTLPLGSAGLSQYLVGGSLDGLAPEPLGPIGSMTDVMLVEGVREELGHLKVPALRELCIQHGLPKSGKKEEFVRRLMEHFHKHNLVPDLSALVDGKKRVAASSLEREDAKRVKREKNKLACQKSRAKKKEEASVQEMQIVQQRTKKSRLVRDVDRISSDVDFLKHVDLVGLDGLTAPEVKRLQSMIKTM